MIGNLGHRIINSEFSSLSRNNYNLFSNFVSKKLIKQSDFLKINSYSENTDSQLNLFKSIRESNELKSKFKLKVRIIR